MAKRSKVKILISTVNSESFEPGNYTGGSFQTPTPFTGTTVTPQISNDGVSWTAVGSAITVTTNTTYIIPDNVFKAKLARLVSGTTEVAERSIIIYLK